MNPKLLELKALLKETAARIKDEKRENKEYQRANNGCMCYFGASSEYFRHHHIAYCELRGRTRDQIERPAENNLPNEAWIARIKAEYAPVCTDS